MKYVQKFVKRCLFIFCIFILPLQSTASNATNNIHDFYGSAKSGKIIDFVGDSTTEAATAMYEHIAKQYAIPGGPLEGATINNRGKNGNTLHNFVNNIVSNGNTIDRVIKDNADLYILSYGINDIRGSAESAGSSPEQIKGDLKIAVDRLLKETNGSILLRIPNPFLTKNPSKAIYLSPIENAQLYSDQLWEIYRSFRNYSERLDIIDIPSLVFGRKAMPEHPLMHDVLHPNDDGYRAIADAIVDRINGKTKDGEISAESYSREVPVNKSIVLLREEKLYNDIPIEPGASSKDTNAKISPQTLHAVAQMSGYYKIKTWLGEKWINPMGGALEVTPSSAYETIQLTTDTFVFNDPYSANTGKDSGLMLAPQQVEVLDRWRGFSYWKDEWFYHIQTKLGPKWINLNYSLPANLQPTNETIEVKNTTDLNKYPWEDAYILGGISPQKVTAFEKGNGWYHIHSWAGDAWINEANIKW